mmetsp:Transcript_86610/g.279660  ORF Transcript_86610/g.279660 Transcript_86610/m.279660 type:complete len:213 (+) Transcript_86610:747-1385(+)
MGIVRSQEHKLPPRLRNLLQNRPRPRDKLRAGGGALGQLAGGHLRRAQALMHAHGGPRRSTAAGSPAVADLVGARAQPWRRTQPTGRGGSIGTPQGCQVVCREGPDKAPKHVHEDTVYARRHLDDRRGQLTAWARANGLAAVAALEEVGPEVELGRAILEVPLRALAAPIHEHGRIRATEQQEVEHLQNVRKQTVVVISRHHTAVHRPIRMT